MSGQAGICPEMQDKQRDVIFERLNEERGSLLAQADLVLLQDLVQAGAREP